MIFGPLNSKYQLYYHQKIFNSALKKCFSTLLIVSKQSKNGLETKSIHVSESPPHPSNNSKEWFYHHWYSSQILLIDVHYYDCWPHLVFHCFHNKSLMHLPKVETSDMNKIINLFHSDVCSWLVPCIISWI